MASKSKIENFLEYEKTNNRFLRELRENREYRDIKQLIIDNNNKQYAFTNGSNGSNSSSSSSSRVDNSAMMILCPHGQSVVTSFQEMRKSNNVPSSSSSPLSAASTTSPSQSNTPVHVSMLEFMQSHVAYCNPRNAQQFISLNGVCGTFSDEFNQVIVLRGPIRGGDDALSFFKDPLSLFDKQDSVFTNFQGRTESWNGGDALHTVQVLRTSEIDLDGTLVKLFLISGPIEYEGCGWVPQHDTSPLKETHDDSVNSRTSTRQGRHRRIKSSANLTERAASPSPSPSTPSSSSRGIWSMFTTKAFSISAPNSSTSSSRSSDAMPLSQSFSGRPTFSRESEDQLSDDNDDDHMEEVDEHDEEDKDYGAAVIGSSVKETENVIGTEQSAVNASDDTSATVAITDGHSGSNGKNFHINKLINLHNISSSNRLFSEQPLFGSTRSRSRSNSSVSAKPQADCDDRAQDDEARKKKFSFQDFVQKMKHKSAIYLVRKIKKFVDDINANGYSNNIPQSVHYFLDEVMVEIHTHEQWKNASDTELDNARESLEKYVMTKIHGKVFSPDVEDLQQDNNLASRLSTFRLLKPENLDIDPMVISDPSWNMALEELKKINKYRAPRDKMICVSNCCRILFGILERISPNEAASADTFLPVLIYLVLKANPPHMHSNLKYIMDFRNPNKMISEAGYFLTNLQSAVVFWENLDHTSLTMEKSEFDRIAGIKTTLFEDEFEMEHGVERDDDDDENNDSVRATIDNSATENEDVAPIQPLPPEEGVMSSQTPVTPAISPIEIMEHQKSSASSSSSSLETSDEETKISVTLKQERQSHDRIDLEAERRKAVANFLSTVQDQWEHSHKEVSSKFIDISSDSLRVGDISELLFQYQILYRFHATIMEHICKHGGGREERLKD